jgi:hypothetical protein
MSYFITSVMTIHFIYAEIVYMNIVPFCTEKFTLIYLWRELVLNLRSPEYWCAVLTSRPPGQPADISVRTNIVFLLCYRELMQRLGSLLLLSVHFSSDRFLLRF